MPVTGPLQYHYRMRVRSHLTPNGNQNPGELRGAQLAFVPIRWDMPCRIDRSRIFRANSLPRVSLRFTLGYLILPLWGGGIDGSS
jgi:hypothetical protein